MSQMETLHSPTGVKTGSKYSELFEGTKSESNHHTMTRSKPPAAAYERNAWRHNMADPRANADVINETFAGHPYAAKPVLFRARHAPSPGRKLKAGAHPSDTMSMASVQSEPAAAFHELTKVNFSTHAQAHGGGRSRKHSKHLRTTTSIESLPQAVATNHVTAKSKQSTQIGRASCRERV